MKVLVLSQLLAALFLSHLLAANPISQAPQESTAGSPLSAGDVSQLKARAEAGDPVAENAIGVMYRTGQGFAQDKEEAVLWFRKAAKHLSADAMFNLGAAYYNGDGVGEDPVSSCAWFLLSQEAGYDGADDAVRRAASESPSRPVEGAERIGEMYQAGKELPKNAVIALKWYRKAADGGSLQASINLATLLTDAPNPTQEESAEAHKRCEDAYKLDYGPAAYCMAVLYKRGLGVTQDSRESAKWLIRAANLGHPKAMLELGEVYWRGEGVSPNLITAYVWIWTAHNLKVDGAEQDEAALRKQIDPKDIEQARKFAENSPVREQLLVRQKTRTGGPIQ